MRLSKLEIYGFKSFAKRTHDHLPRKRYGYRRSQWLRGKSNIADAVRWVLGEQSAKQLRGKQMTDVIFNGTQQRKAMGYCEVTLTFDNTGGELKTEYSEVSRHTARVSQRRERLYHQRQNSCRLKDIIDLFRDTGIGKEGYSIVGQGRMDEILSNRQSRIAAPYLRKRRASAVTAPARKRPQRRLRSQRRKPAPRAGFIG